MRFGMGAWRDEKEGKGEALKMGWERKVTYPTATKSLASSLETKSLM